MPTHRGKQKSVEKQKKKRAALRKKDLARKAERAIPTSSHGLIRKALEFPRGPSYVSADFRSLDMPPTLVSVFVTRRAPGGQVIFAVALVDRTCLGVKNGFVRGPVPEAEFESMLAKAGSTHEGGIEECDFLTAQSIVFNAVDYARSLGFEPHADFAAPLFGPRPEVLLDTPFAKPDKPFYVSGPDDDSQAIFAQIRKKLADELKVGLEAGVFGPVLEGDDDDDDDEGDDEEGDEGGG